MTLIDKIAWDDTVLPFQLDRADVRGRIARLDGVLSGVLKQHDYPPAVEALVAEMALLTALIGQSIKLRWKLSLRFSRVGSSHDRNGLLRPENEGEPARIAPMPHLIGIASPMARALINWMKDILLF